MNIGFNQHYILAAQDNDAFEKGWVLGTRRTSFSFALSTVGSDNRDGLLTYLSTPDSYDMKEWYHVVGTYCKLSLTWD